MSIHRLLWNVSLIAVSVVAVVWQNGLTRPDSSRPVEGQLGRRSQPCISIQIKGYSGTRVPVTCWHPTQTDEQENNSLQTASTSQPCVFVHVKGSNGIHALMCWTPTRNK